MRRRRHWCRRTWALAAGLALAVWASPAAAQSPATPVADAADPRAHASACDPQVAEALAGSAQAGVEADLAILRHPDQGIRNPDSILDFSCIGDLFDYRAFDILFDPAGALEDILDLARRRICAAARDAYRRYLGRALDPAVYAVPARRLPGLAGPAGLEVDWERRNAIDDVSGKGAGALFRDVVGDTRAGDTRAGGGR